MVLGSSRIRKFDSESMSFARETRPRSPPERSFDPFEYIVSGKQKRSQRIADFRVVQDGYFVRNFFKQRFIGMQDVMLLIVVADLHLAAESDSSGVRFHQLVDEFKIVVFPVPLSPMIATCSPRFNAKERSENSVLRSKVLPDARRLKRRFRFRCGGSAVSAYRNAPQLVLSSTSILASIFSRLSARLIDFSRLKDFNFVMTSS